MVYSQDHLLNERSFALAAYNVLSKVASAALILPISEAIGQLKWTWFHGTESKEMIDFEIFDKASRGAWGSFLLLCRTKGRSLAALGAVLTLLLLATDTFFQQVTNYPDRWALESIGSAIPRVVRYEPFYTPEYSQGLEMSFLNPALRPVIGQFMVDNGTQPISFGNGTRPEIPLSCPSSNCTWPTYDTLAVCSKCIEVSDLLEYACRSTSIDWSVTQTGPIDSSKFPNKTVCGFFFNSADKSPTLMSGHIVEDNGTRGESLLVRTLPLTDMISKVPVSGGSIHFKHIRNPILDAIIVSTANGSHNGLANAVPIAHECVLAWCVQTIRSSYALGEYKEEIVARRLNTSEGPWPWSAYPVYMDNEIGGWMNIYKEAIAITPPDPASNASNFMPSSLAFGSSNTTVSNVMQVFDDYFPSTYTVKTPAEQPMLRYKNYLDGPKMRMLKFNPFLAPNNVTRHMERLATAMSNVMRSDVDSSEMISGLAYNKKQFVIVSWEWLIFPIALLLLSLVFLVATVFRTSRDAHGEMGVWKTSAMPTLMYSLPKDVQKELNKQGPRATPGDGKPRKVKIQLLPSQGWRVSGYSLSSPTLRRGLTHQPPPGWI